MLSKDDTLSARVHFDILSRVIFRKDNFPLNKIKFNLLLNDKVLMFIIFWIQQYFSEFQLIVFPILVFFLSIYDSLFWSLFRRRSSLLI